VAKGGGDSFWPSLRHWHRHTPALGAGARECRCCFVAKGAHRSAPRAQPSKRRSPKNGRNDIWSMTGYPLAFSHSHLIDRLRPPPAPPKLRSPSREKKRRETGEGDFGGLRFDGPYMTPPSFGHHPNSVAKCAKSSYKLKSRAAHLEEGPVSEEEGDGWEVELGTIDLERESDRVTVICEVIGGEVYGSMY